MKVAESYEQLMDSIGEVRGRVAALTTYSKEVLDKYLSGYFTNVNPTATGHRNLADWFADAEHGASSRAILTFLDEHRQEVALQTQRPEAQVAIASAKESRCRKELEGVRQRWISPRAIKTQAEVGNTEIVVGDIFDTTLADRDGYHYMGSNWIVVAQGGRTLKDRQEFMLHKIDGESFDHEMNHRRFGSKLRLARFREEALAEHEALTFQVEGRGVKIMHPTKREKAGFARGAYLSCRALLAAENGAGRFPIDTRTAILAHTSGSEESPEFQHYDYLLDQAWGMKGFRKWVDASVSYHQSEIEKRIQGISHDMAMKIAASEVEKILVERSYAMRAEASKSFAEVPA